jgi:Ion channel/EF hand
MSLGYGDVVPNTRNAQIFTCIWALSGVAFLGVALGILGSNLIVVHEQQKEDAQVRRQLQAIRGFLRHYATCARKDDDQDTSQNKPNAIYNLSPVSMSSTGGYSTIEEGKRRTMFDDIDDSDDEDPHFIRHHHTGANCWEHRFSCLCSGTILRVAALFVFLVGTLYLLSIFEDWDVTTTVYYGIITASTVGYGDFSPKTDEGRFVAILFIPAAVCVMGYCLDLVSTTIIEYRRKHSTNYLLGNRPFTLEDIRNWDGDGDGEVTRLEFLEFMLVAMGQVDKGLLDDLKAHFNRLDVNGSGTINKEDLAIIAKQRLHSRTKLKCSADNDGHFQKARQDIISSASPATSIDITKVTIAPLSLERTRTEQTSNKSSVRS